MVLSRRRQQPVGLINDKCYIDLMSPEKVIQYTVNDPIELNLSYMPFINDGGLFIPVTDKHHLGEMVMVELQLPGKPEAVHFEGKVVWITPSNALHHVLPGIGVQFTGTNKQAIKTQIEAYLDTNVDIGGYTYGIK